MSRNRNDSYNFCSITWVLVCTLLLAGNVYSLPARKISTPSKWANNEEIALFREYLRIPTVQPNVDYKPAVDFLLKQAANLSLPVSIHYPVDENNPVLVMTWGGSEPNLPTIMLNSHMDVVPVYEEYWTHPPFAAEMEENGDIYARGAQDMKFVGMEYLAAIRSLKRQGINRLKRTIHVIFVPDEETGGLHGMEAFSRSDEFKALNVAFALDEGGTPIDEEGTLPAYYIERTLWRIEFVFHGQSGHGSLLFNNTPGEKLNYVVGKLTEYREKEKKKLEELKHPYGNVTSINLTMLSGGVAVNVIPAEMSATFDMRVSATTGFEQFEQMVMQWCEEAGGNITINTLDRGDKEIPTRVDDSNPFWVALKNGVTKVGLKVKPVVLTPNSDMRFLRRFDISAIGFAPMMNTTLRAHDHNEYLNAETYLAGIEVYKSVITSLASV